MKLEITPRQNGIHSLAKALEAFEKYHQNPNDVFALKDSILRSHHALETLFKDILYSWNPCLLVDENKKIKDFLEGFTKWCQGKIATPLDELPTVTLREVIHILKDLDFFTDLSDKEYYLFLESIGELCLYRNRLQHFSLSADPDRIGRILGSVLPRAIDILEPFFSMPSTFGSPINLTNECSRFFSNTKSIIALLRTNYNRLIQEAIEFFRKTPFNDQILNLIIVDHGHVGVSPYYPELTIKGFLDFKYDIRTRLDFFGIHRAEDEEPYSGKINLGEPKFTIGEKGSPYSVAEGSLEFNSRILIDRADKILVLQNAQDKLAGLRGLTIMIKANLKYRADAIKTESHYNCRTIQEASGQLTVRLNAVPKGNKSEETELIGLYQSELNKENAPFRLHSFLKPDGSLKEDAPRILEWSVNTKGNLSFK